MRDPIFNGPGSIRRALATLVIAVGLIALPFIIITIAHGLGY